MLAEFVLKLLAVGRESQVPTRGGLHTDRSSQESPKVALGFAEQGSRVPRPRDHGLGPNRRGIRVKAEVETGLGRPAPDQQDHRRLALRRVVGHVRAALPVVGQPPQQRKGLRLDAVDAAIVQFGLLLIGFDPRQGFLGLIVHDFHGSQRHGTVTRFVGMYRSWPANTTPTGRQRERPGRPGRLPGRCIRRDRWALLHQFEPAALDLAEAGVVSSPSPGV